MAAKDCIKQIVDASGGKLSDDDVAEIVDTVERRLARYRRANPMSGANEAEAAVIKELSDEAQLADIIEKRNRALNVVAKKRRNAFYDKNGKTAQSLRALNVTSQRGFEGAAQGVDVQKQGIEVELMGGMTSELRKAGLLELLGKRTKDFDRDVSRELWRLTDKTGPASGNKRAEEVAKIIGRWQEAARQLQNAAGAWIGKVPGYIVRQSHDEVRVGKNFQEWRDTILPLLDESTFDGVTDRDKFLTKAWEGIKSGIHHKTHDADSWLGGFKGPGNLAKKVSQERTLHFKDADSWFEYNEKYGTGSLMDAVISGLHGASRTTALMRVWGPNPEAAFNADLGQLKESNRTDSKKLSDLEKKGIKDEFNVVNGTANIAGNPNAAQINANVRAWISMSKLGGVVLSSINDIGSIAATLRHNGVGYLEGVGLGFQNVLRGRGNNEQREIADLVLAGVSGVMGDVYGRFGATDTLNGKMSKLMKLYFKANGLQFWTDAQKTGVSLILARNLEMQRAKGFGDLPERLAVNLRRYGIDEEAWGHIQRMDHTEADGQKYITADKVSDLGLDKRQTRELTTKINSYYADQVREALTEQGARERALTTGRASAGTLEGEAIRYFLQFKNFGISFATNHIAREFVRLGRPDLMGISMMMVGMTTLGYVSMTAKEFIKGKNPRPLDDKATWLAALTQGGGMGIYGDFLFGDFNRFGQSPIATLGGPAVGTAEQVLRILGAARKNASDTLSGDDTDLSKTGSALFKLGIDNTPFLNLFYTRMALDYAFLYNIQEAMNPGYLSRMEKRVKKENGQTYWLPPTSVK